MGVKRVLIAFRPIEPLYHRIKREAESEGRSLNDTVTRLVLFALNEKRPLKEKV